MIRNIANHYFQMSWANAAQDRPELSFLENTHAQCTLLQQPVTPVITPHAVIGPRRLGPLKERKVYRHIWLGSDCCRKIMLVKILVVRNPCFNIFPGMPKGAFKSESSHSASMGHGPLASSLFMLGFDVRMVCSLCSVYVSLMIFLSTHQKMKQLF